MTMTMMMVKDDDKNDGGNDEVGVGELRHSCICIPDLLWGSKWKIRVEVDSGWWWRCWWRSWWWWWWLSWIWHRFDENHNFFEIRKYDSPLWQIQMIIECSVCISRLLTAVQTNRCCEEANAMQWPFSSRNMICSVGNTRWVSSGNTGAKEEQQQRPRSAQ